MDNNDNKMLSSLKKEISIVKNNLQNEQKEKKRLVNIVHVLE